jgi:flagellar motility protein MotE (MotC chaperone)
METPMDWSRMRAACAAAGPDYLMLYELLYKHEQQIQALLQQTQADQQQAQARTQELEALNQRIAVLEARVDGQYAAMEADYEALTQEHEELQAAYVVAAARTLALDARRN